eukprot:4079559-Pyramimonas_sp.AAC.1
MCSATVGRSTNCGPPRAAVMRESSVLARPARHRRSEPTHAITGGRPPSWGAIRQAAPSPLAPASPNNGPMLLRFGPLLTTPFFELKDRSSRWNLAWSHPPMISSK